MIASDLSLTLLAAHDAGVLRLPHGVPPLWEDPHEEIDEAAWAAVEWNPPAGQAVSHPDPTASPKPSMQWLRLRNTPSAADLVQAVRIVARRRIVRAYGATSEIDEVHRRLGGETTLAQNVERDRLRAVCRQLITQIETMAPSERRAFDPTADENWLDE